MQTETVVVDPAVRGCGPPAADPVVAGATPDVPAVWAGALLLVVAAGVTAAAVDVDDPDPEAPGGVGVVAEVSGAVLEGVDGAADTGPLADPAPC